VRRGELLERHVGNHLDRLAHVVEAQHGVGEHHVEVGRAEVVVRGLGNFFEASHNIVGQKSDRTAEEARQSRELRRAQALHFGAQLVERVGDRANFDAASGTDDIHAVLARADYHRGFGAKEREAAPLLAAADALEQERVVVARDLQKGRDRSFKVGGYFLVDRDQVESLRRQFFEFFLARLEHFASSYTRFPNFHPAPNPAPQKAKGRRTFARGPSEIGFAMNYKAGAQAGASTCQRHHPAQSTRLTESIVRLVIHTARQLVNRPCCDASCVGQCEVV
jgi:hypothetical protein